MDRRGLDFYSLLDMPRFSPSAELAHLRRLNTELAELVEMDESLLVRPATSISGWTALQHAAHMMLANELVLRNLRNLVKGSGLFVVTEAQQSAEALSALERGDLRRGQAKAPRMVVPPADVDRATVAQWIAEIGRDLAAFERELPIDLPRAFVPHQILGPLDASEWARFGVVHTAHHLVIAREVLAAVGALQRG